LSYVFGIFFGMLFFFSFLTVDAYGDGHSFCSYVSSFCMLDLFSSVHSQSRFYSHSCS
jgi:hypothetical protein